MEEKTIELGANVYRIKQCAAGPEAFALYHEIMGHLAPVVGAAVDGALRPIFGSPEVREAMAGKSGKEALGAVAPLLFDVLGKAGESATFARIGGELGKLLGNPGFRSAAERLFVQSVSTEMVVHEPGRSEPGRQTQPFAHSGHVQTHFSAHLQDYLPVLMEALRVNYARAFSGAFGLLPTSPKAGAGAPRAA